MNLHRNHRGSFLFALSLCATSLCATSLSAEDDRLNRHPTLQRWLNDVTPATIVNYTEAGYRITDLEVTSPSPLRMSVAMVRNTGAYAKRWFWYYGQTVSSLSSLINSLGVRIVDLEPYVVSGNLYFAALMEDNQGANAKAWWWYVGAQFSTLQTLYQNNNARIIDLDKYTVGTTTAYACVMIRNTGADARSWSWALNYAGADVTARLNTIGHRLYDIERNDTGSYNFISVDDNAPVSYWFNVTPTYAESLRASANARMIDLEPQSDGRYTIVMMRNSGFFTAVGASCGSGFSHSATGNPAPGQSVQFRLTTPSSYSGFSTMMLSSGSTSVDLGFIGAPGCRLHVTLPNVQIPILAVGGGASVQFTVPNLSSVIGTRIHTQFIVPKPGHNALGLLTTNGLTTTFGPVQ